MDLYREQILEHWQNPLNFGKIKNANLTVKQVNLLCGDTVTFYFKVKAGKILQVSFVGDGCAISIASASILSEAVKGKSFKQIKALRGEDVFRMLGGPVSPARIKCAFLAFEAVRKVSSI
jgi:nitrogen fixation protein NifU and related proteins